MRGDRYDEDWQLHTCVDCDPEYADEDNPEDEAHKYDKPYVMVIPVGDPAPDTCPRCGSYLGMTDGDNKLKITNTPATRSDSYHSRADECRRFSAFDAVIRPSARRGRSTGRRRSRPPTSPGCARGC